MRDLLVTGNNFTVVDVANQEAIKFRADAHPQNCLSVNNIALKLPRPSYKSYVNNISLFEACFLKLKFRLSENILSSSAVLALVPAPII